MVTTTQIALGIMAAAGSASAMPEHWHRGPPCKAYPGMPWWPNEATWAGLNKTVNGALIRPVMPAGACHKGQSNYNPDQCPTIEKEWETSEFHLADPVSVMSNEFTNNTCLPDPKYPCSPAGYPAYVIKVTSAQDAKAGVDFARTNNVRLNVKSSGHDFLGRSVAPGSLSLWTHGLNSISYHADQFTMASGRVFKGNSVTFGSGAIMWDLYVALDAYKQTVVGGGSKTVSAGGYISGGGHSILSPRYGMAADQVIEMEVVTPDGKIQKVNQDQNTDLFWAIRGGGGSTFGVVTSFTVKTVPSPKMTVASFLAYTTPGSPILSDLIGYVGSQTPSLMNGGFAGYNIISTNISSPAPGSGLPDPMAGFTGNMAIQDDPNANDTIAKLLAPLNSTINQRWPRQAGFSYSTTEYSSFLDFFKDDFDTEAVGDQKYLISRLLPQESFNDEKALGKALLSATGPGGFSTFFLVGGKGVMDAQPVGGMNSVNSHWRTAYVHTISATMGTPFNKAATNGAIKQLDADWAPLRNLSSSSGAYLNEASPFEPNFRQSFWGSNYERLAKIKKQVDPNDVFWCNPCVGNENWRQLDNGMLCRV